jgi:hypothetical protein
LAFLQGAVKVLVQTRSKKEKLSEISEAKDRQLKRKFSPEFIFWAT